MNFFLFDPETRTLITAKTLWHYFATSVPVTLCVILAWNVWVKRERMNDPYLRTDACLGSGGVDTGASLVDGTIQRVQQSLGGEGPDMTPRLSGVRRLAAVVGEEVDMKKRAAISVSMV